MRKHIRVQIDCSGDSLTKQSFAQECDVNWIVSRYMSNPNSDYSQRLANGQVGQYGDFSNVPNYREALDTVRVGEESFMRLPPKLRTRFSNDAGIFMDFVSDPSNRAEMRTLGLLKPQKPVENEAKNVAVE
ncbi:hypothetical protein [Shewanella sp.]|uniref:hypothetical protein n=1 Tax=Shewanella sp. TaxID=50422 RepID=UPI00404784F4